MIERIAKLLATVEGAEVLKPDAALSGVHVDVFVPAAGYRQAVEIVRQNEFLIESLTAVDALPLMVVSHYAHTEADCRVAVRTPTDRVNPSVPTVQDIFPGANWHERETHDFFGVKFEGHPDLTPLILPEDAGDLRPLRKKEEKVKELGALVGRFAKPAEAAKAEVTE